MGSDDDFENAAPARRRKSLLVSLENRPERLLRSPFGVNLREVLDAVQGKGHLRIHGLLDPERAVVVERRHTLFGFGKGGIVRVGDRANEVDDLRLVRGVVPGGKRVDDGFSVDARLLYPRRLVARTTRDEPRGQKEHESPRKSTGESHGANFRRGSDVRPGLALLFQRCESSAARNVLGSGRTR